MMEQNVSKINRQQRNQSLAARVVKRGAFLLPTVCVAHIMKT